MEAREGLKMSANDKAWSILPVLMRLKRLSARAPLWYAPADHDGSPSRPAEMMRASDEGSDDTLTVRFMLVTIQHFLCIALR
jgi:hypothetical protein